MWHRKKQDMQKNLNTSRTRQPSIKSFAWEDEIRLPQTKTSGTKKRTCCKSNLYHFLLPSSFILIICDGILPSSSIIRIYDQLSLPVFIIIIMYYHLWPSSCIITYHHLLPWWWITIYHHISSHITSYHHHHHHHQPSSFITIKYHHLLPSSLTIMIFHHLSPSSCIIIMYHHLLPSSSSIISFNR